MHFYLNKFQQILTFLQCKNLVVLIFLRLIYKVSRKITFLNDGENRLKGLGDDTVWTKLMSRA